MLWVINGLIYGFFTALYTLVNQHYKLNGYVLGIWRGFGVSLCFLPFIFLLPLQTDAYIWALLIFQGVLIGIYDSHLFFASAAFGAGPTSRVMALTSLITSILWWAMTPNLFDKLVADATSFITLILILFGFTFCYWYMIKSTVTREVVNFMVPAVLALAGMSIATKEIALINANVWVAVVYYLVVATAVSGLYNTVLFVKHSKPGFVGFFRRVFNKKVVKAGVYIISFSAALITAKTLALRVAPNPGYVVALVLTAPLFVFALNKYHKVPDDVSIRAGFAMIFFLILLILLVNGQYGIVD